MFGKKQAIINDQNKRIELLEWLICQGNHDYKVVNTYENLLFAGGAVDIEYTDRLRCTKCLKETSIRKY